MKLSKNTVDKIDKIYKPGMTAKKLAKAAGVEVFKVHRYLAQRLFEEDVFALRKCGSSFRKISKELNVPHVAAHRIVLDPVWTETGDPGLSSAATGK